MKQRRRNRRHAVLAALVVLTLAWSPVLGGGMLQALAEEPSVGADGDFSAASDGASAVASTDVGMLVESDLAVTVTPESACGLPDDVAAVTLEASATGAVGTVVVRWTRTVEGSDGVERDDAAFSAVGASHRLAGDDLRRGATYRYRATVEDAAGAKATGAAVAVSLDYRDFHDGAALVDDASGVAAEGLFYDDGRERAALSVRPVDPGESSDDLSAVYGALAQKAAELGGSIGRAYEVSLLLPAGAPAGIPAYVGGVQVSLPVRDSATMLSLERAIARTGALGASRVRVVHWDAASGAAVEVPGGARVTTDGTQAVFSADELGMYAIVRGAPLPDAAHEVAVSANAGGTVLYQGVPARGSVTVPHDADARFQVVAQAGYVIDRVLVDGSPVDAAAGFSSWYVELAKVGDSTRSIAVTFRAVKPVPGVQFTLVTSAGDHGAVDPDTGPAGVRVQAGSVQTVRFLPEAGYRVSSVTVTQNGTTSSVPALGDAYVFAVVADVSVQVEFEEGGNGPALVHKIVASAGEHGSVSPASATVPQGGEATFSFLPEEGYRVAAVLVDGEAVETGSSYTFRWVVADHRLNVLFEPDESSGGANGAGGAAGTSYVVRASAGPGGRVSPSGAVNVSEGASATFAFIPDEGFAVSHVVVDGRDVGYAPRSWTLDDVRENHTVQVSFSRVRALGLAPTGDGVVSLVALGGVLAIAAAVLAVPKRRRPAHKRP